MESKYKQYCFELICFKILHESLCIASVYHVQDFKYLYDIFGSWSPSEKDVLDFPSKVIIWLSIYSDSLQCQ